MHLGATVVWKSRHTSDPKRSEERLRIVSRTPRSDRAPVIRFSGGHGRSKSFAGFDFADLMREVRAVYIDLSLRPSKWQHDGAPLS